MLRAPSYTMRIRNRLLLLVLALFLPMFVASALVVWYVYREEQKSQERSVAETARAFALLVDSELRVREGILQTMVNSPSLQNSLRSKDFSLFYSYARNMAPNPDTAIVLSELDGRQIFNTRVEFGEQLPARRSSNLTELVHKYGADSTLVSDLFFSQVGERYDFNIQVPVKVDGQVRYFLIMGIQTAQLQALFRAQRFPAKWIGTVVDRKGTVVARSADPEQNVGRVLRESSLQQLAAGREGVYRSVTLDGIRVKAFYSHVPNADWTVLISIPEAEVRRVAFRAAALLGAVMVLLLALAVIAARRFAAGVIRPIEDLGRTADRLGQGQEVAYTSQGLAEADTVGYTMVNASRQILRAKAELEQRVADAVSAFERAQTALLQSQKLEALGRLTGGIAHEFNNLLQTLSTALQLAEMTSDRQRMQSLIDTCKKTVDRATSLTSQLSSFGRIQDARLATTSVKERVDTFVQLVHNILPSNITLEVDCAPDLWPVTVDPLQFELALLNIALNAKDAMPEGGRLRVQASNVDLQHPSHGLPAGGYVRITVSDTGAGMPPDVLAKALDPFFTTKGVGKGTGLGLPQAYGFATQSHGMLVLNSTPGAGTSVGIYLPRSALPVSVPSGKEGAWQANGIDAGSTDRGTTVLLVEDDALVREAVLAALEKAGFRMLVACSGDAALAMLESGVQPFPDVVFSDIVMPGQIGGIELAKIVSERFPGIRMVLSTGYTDKRVEIPGVHLLAKPYEIGAAVRLLSRSGS